MNVVNWIKSVMIVSVVTIVTIKVVDFGFGIYRPFDTDTLISGKRSILLRLYNPNQTALVIPSDSYMHNTDSLIQKKYHISIDADGFIENGNLNLENSNIVIAFIGGSTTESIFVDEKDRFPSIVERQLREKFSSGIKTINAGVSGNNSIHSLLNFQAKILPKKPNIAVLMHNINDFALLSKTGSYWVAPEGKNILQGIDTGFKDATGMRLFERMRKAKNILIPNLYAYLKPRLFPNLDISDEFYEYRGSSIGAYSMETVYMFENSLRSFVMLSNAWGVKPILMTQFNRVSTSDPMFMKWITGKGFGQQAQEVVDLYNNLNKITRKVAADTDTHLIDLDIEIPKTSRYIYDVVHLNNNGSRLAGNIIQRELIKVIEN